MAAEQPERKRVDLVFEGGGVKGVGLAGAYSVELYESGRAAAEDFLGTWGFASYVRAFRAGIGIPRRRDLLTPVAAS